MCPCCYGFLSVWGSVDSWDIETRNYSLDLESNQCSVNYHALSTYIKSNGSTENSKEERGFKNQIHQE